MKSYYASFEIVQAGYIFRCDLPYNSSKKGYVLEEVISHVESILQNPINDGLINMHGMNTKDFAKDLVINEATAEEKYDTTFQHSIDNWKVCSTPVYFQYRFRLNPLGEYHHVPYVNDDVPWKIKAEICA